MEKIRKIVSDIRQTNVVDRPRISFIYYYLITKCASFLRRKSKISNTLIRRYVAKNAFASFVIKNSFGYFKVRPLDDSLTMASNYFEENLQPWLQRPVSKKIFIDIGANIGRYSLISINKFGYERSYAFEPNLHTASIFRENIKLNKLEDRIKITEKGLGEESKKVSFSEDSLNGVGDHVVEGEEEKSNQSGASSVTQVDIISFDDWLKSEFLDIKDISFIKMDVEGYEYHALRGMLGTLNKLDKGTCLMIEISKRNSEVFDLLTKSGMSLQEQIHSDYLFIKEI